MHDDDAIPVGALDDADIDYDDGDPIICTGRYRTIGYLAGTVEYEGRVFVAIMSFDSEGSGEILYAELLSSGDATHFVYRCSEAAFRACPKRIRSILKRALSEQIRPL